MITGAVKIFVSKYHARFLIMVLIKGSHSQVFFKIGVLKILWNSQENICVGVSFLIKLQAQAAFFIWKE